MRKINNSNRLTPTSKYYTPVIIITFSVFCLIWIFVMHEILNSLNLNDSAHRILDTILEIILLIVTISFVYYLLRRDIDTINKYIYELSESEKKHKRIIDDQTEFVCRWLPDGTITYINNAYANYLGKTKEEILGMVLPQMIPEEDRELFEQHFKSITFDNCVKEIEHRFINFDGSVRWHHWTDRAIFDENKNLVEYQSVGRDITEKKLMEEELTRSENQLRENEKRLIQLAESTFEGICIHRDLTIIDMNQQLGTMFGYTKDEVIGKNVTDFIAPESQELVKQNIKSGYEGAYEFTGIKKNGSQIFIEGRGKNITLNGIPSRITILRDITEQKNNEISLRKSEEFNRTIIEDFPLGISVYDKYGTLLNFNKEWQKIWHYSDDDISLFKSRKRKELYFNEEQSYLGEWIEKVKDIYKKGGKLFIPELKTNSKALGAAKWISQYYFAILDKENKVDSVINITEDITLRKHILESLQVSEEKYKQLFDNSPISLWEEDFSKVKKLTDTLKKKGINNLEKYFDDNPDELLKAIKLIKCLSVNKTTLKMYDAENSDLLTKNFHYIFCEESLPALKEGIINIAGGEKSFEKDSVNKTLKGEIKNISLKWIVAPGYESTYSKVLLAITDITERKNYEKQLKEINETLTALINSSPASIVILDKEAKVKLWNPASENIFGWSAEEIIEKIIPFVTPENLDEHIALHNKTLNDESIISTDITRNRKDGSVVHLNLSTAPLKDAEGIIKGVLGVMIDITEKKINEQKLIHTLKEKELMIKEIHHRVKNNLQIILSLLRLQSDNVSDKELNKHFRITENRIKTMALIHEMLYNTEDLSEIDFKQYLNKLFDHLYNVFSIQKSNIKSELYIDEVFLPIDIAIPCGLIINEITTNSIKHAFPESRDGKISVKMFKDENNYYILEIRDNGIGIPEAVNLMDTKTLGMQLVYALTEQLNGEINFKIENGTRMILKFPVNYQERKTENSK